MQIIQDRNPWEPFAQGFSQGLQNLAQGIAQGQQKSAYKKALIASGSYTPEQAELIIRAPEKVQKEYIKNLAMSKDIGEEEAVISGQPKTTSLSSSLQGLGSMPQEQEAAQTLNQLAPERSTIGQANVPADFGAQLGQIAQQQKRELVNKIIGGDQQRTPSSMELLQNMGRPGGIDMLMGQQNPYQQQPLQQAPYQQPQEVAPTQGMVRPSPAPAPEAEKAAPTFNDLSKEMEDKAARYRKAAEIANRKGATERAKGYREEAKALEERAENYRKEEERKDTYNKDYVKEVTSTARSSKEQNQIVQQQLDLKRKGLLPSMGNELLASAVGRLTPGLQEYLQKSPGAEFFRKLGAAQLKGLRNMFGSKITEREMVYFMQQFPSLKMTPEGLEVMGRFFDLAEQKAALRSDIMRKNLKDSSISKYDLEKKTEEEFQEKMKSLPGQTELDNYIKELYKKSPEGRKEAAEQARKEALAKPAGTPMGSAKGYPEGTILPGKGGKPDLISKGGQWITL